VSARKPSLLYDQWGGKKVRAREANRSRKAVNCNPYWMKYKYQVFISYSSGDVEWARRLYQELTARGITVFFDRARPFEGAVWDPALQGAISDSRHLLIIWSHHAHHSAWVAQEIGHFQAAIRGTLVSKDTRRIILLNLEGRNEAALEFEQVDHVRQAGLYSLGVGALDSHPQLWSEVLDRITDAVSPESLSTSNVATESGAGTNGVLFVCYRRDDTQHAAGRLHDRLTEAYGSDRVFMDIDSVPLGVDFVEHVSHQIARCAAVVVMIGRKWLRLKGKDRRRRLDSEDDLVRAEIAAALQQKIPVIPLLVENAKMPSATDLPDNIRLLARRNGIELSATRWKTDVERLIKELDRVMKA
jgi:hypothetical protein